MRGTAKSISSALHSFEGKVFYAVSLNQPSNSRFKSSQRGLKILHELYECRHSLLRSMQISFSREEVACMARRSITTNGQPQAIASITTFGQPSTLLNEANTSARIIKAHKFET
jgi:hypothetical protein